MKKFNIDSVTQGLIIMTLGFIADTYLLGFMLYKFNAEKTLFVALFITIDILILIVINQLIKERNKK
jgi:hypothetical protein